jgi:uncharacterized protein (DUF488 family)
MPTIHTVGHSVLPLEHFLEALSGAGIAAIADVRRFPASRRHPHFAAGPLREALAARAMGYAWFEDLGGRRSVAQPGPDTAAWRVAAFRAYAEYMRGEVFTRALERLEEFTAGRPTAVMCAEALWTRCHRRLIADALTARGWRVLHLLPPRRIEEHHLPPFAVLDAGGLRYPAAV